MKAAFGVYTTSPQVRDIGPENGAGIRYLNGPVLSDAITHSASVINGALARDSRIIDLAEHVIGRRVRPPLRVIFQLLDSAGSRDELDREQILHADKAYPCVKAIYALDDITTEAGPFIYAKGTHQLSRGAFAIRALDGHLRGVLAAWADGRGAARRRHSSRARPARHDGRHDAPDRCRRDSDGLPCQQPDRDEQRGISSSWPAVAWCNTPDPMAQLLRLPTALVRKGWRIASPAHCWTQTTCRVRCLRCTPRSNDLTCF